MSSPAQPQAPPPRQSGISPLGAEHAPSHAAKDFSAPSAEPLDAPPPPSQPPPSPPLAPTAHPPSPSSSTSLHSAELPSDVTEIGALQVRLLAGSGLPAVNYAMQGLSDPFCQIYVRRTRQMRESEINYNTVHPRWHQTFLFDNVRSDDVLDVYCWDYNLTHANVPLGALSIPVSHALKATQSLLDSPSAPIAEIRSGTGTGFVSVVDPFASSEPVLAISAGDSDSISMRHASYSELTLTNTLCKAESLAPSLESPEEGPSPGGTMPSASPQPPLSLDTDAAAATPKPNAPPLQTPDHAQMSAPSPPSPLLPTSKQSLEPASQQSLQQKTSFVQEDPTPPAPLQPSAFSSLKPALTEALHGALHSYDSNDSKRKEYYSAPSREMPYSSMRMDFDEKRVDAMQLAVGLVARSYPLKTQGELTFAVMDSTFPDVSAVLHRNKYKMFVTFKYSEKMRSEVVMKPLKLLSKRALARAAAAAKPVTDKVKQLQLHQVGKEFPTWKIDMLYVYQVFGAKRQGWNRDYEAAKKIFESAAVRSVVKAQHAMLYGGTGLAGTTNVRHSLLAETGAISGGMEFLQLLRMGTRKGKARAFTYVLKPDRLYIAETGADYFTDMNSKHAMHANGEEEVVYAGELVICRRSEDGEVKYTIVLDNNSGTYAPRKEELPMLLAVFKRNFSSRNISFEAFDRDDPRLKEYQCILSYGESTDVLVESTDVLGESTDVLGESTDVCGESTDVNPEVGTTAEGD